jgi:hypothetical protein
MSHELMNHTLQGGDYSMNDGLPPKEYRESKEAELLHKVKHVLKNSQTLKEQLKGVCECYDDFTEAQPTRESYKTLSLMKNFFL